MNIDFSWSKDDWLAIIKQFLEIIQNFFKEIGIDIFKTGDEEEATTAAT